MSDLPKGFGVRSVDDPSRWRVPPWRPGAEVHDVVRHFLRFAPDAETSIDERLGYYRAFLRAIETAPRSGAGADVTLAWLGELRHCLVRCLDTLDVDATGAHRPASSRAPGFSTAPRRPVTVAG